MPRSTTFAERRAACERGLIAAATFGEGEGEILAAVEPKELSKESRGLWEACRAIYREHGHLDEVLLTAAPSIDAESVDAVLRLGSATLDAHRQLGEVRTAHAIDRTMRLCRATLSKLESQPMNASTVAEGLEEYAALLQGIARGLNQEREGRSLLEATMQAVKRATEDNGHGVALTTGIPDLDSRLGGGLKQGTFSVILGRSGHGKSSLALTIALLAGNAGRRCLYVSREMAREELSWRFAAASSRTSITYLQRDVPRDPALAQSIIDAAALPIDIEDKLGHIDAICALVNSEHAQGNPYALVVLDFMQIMQAEGDEQHQRLEAMAYACKNLSMQTECVVLGLVQPNRAGSKTEGMLTMDAIRGSSAIENATDNIISVCRKDPIQPGSAFPFFFKLEKARNGQPGGLEGKYLLGPGTFVVEQWESEKRPTLAEGAAR